MAQTQIIDTATSSPSYFLALPIEILRCIASNLKKAEAKNLALTCVNLQEVGESIIWRQLSLTDRDFAHLISSPCPSAREYVPPVTPSSHVTVTTPSASRSLLATLHSLLSAQPWRPAQLRSLSLDLRYELPSSLSSILNSAKALEHLEIRTPGPSFHSTSYSLTATLDLLRSLSQPLVSLRHLRIDVRYRWNETLVEIVRQAPNLESLHILSHPRRISGGVPPIKSRMIPTSTLPRLKELIVDEMEQSFVATLTPLVEAADRLEAVALRDHAHRWKADSACPLMFALASKTRLKRLECTSMLFPFFVRPGFEAVESLSMLWSTDLVFSSSKRDMIIPPLLNLQIYQIDISLHTSSSDLDLHRHMLILPQIAHDLLGRCIPNIHTCPSLTTLYFPPHLDYDTRQGRICPSPPSINRGDFSGMVIRTYRDAHGDRGIRHCRSRITSEYPLLSRPADWAERYGVTCWEESVMDEQGKVVPVSVLAAMFAAGGIKVDDLPLSREVLLPEECWSVLRCWEMNQ